VGCAVGDGEVGGGGGHCYGVGGGGGGLLDEAGGDVVHWFVLVGVSEGIGRYILRTTL